MHFEQSARQEMLVNDPVITTAGPHFLAAVLACGFHFWPICDITGSCNNLYGITRPASTV